MKEIITIEGVGPDTLAIALKAVMGNGTKPTIQNAVAAIMAGNQLPTEQQQRTNERGMPLHEAVGKIMTAPNGTYRSTVDGRLVAKKAGNDEPVQAKKAEGRWSYAKKMMREDEA